MPHSSSDQTGIRPSRISQKNFFSRPEDGKRIEENHYTSTSGEHNWQIFWPRKSPRSETFFRYNAKPLVTEEKVVADNIPEEISDSRKASQGNKSKDPLTSYLEKEKEKNKIRPKVGEKSFYHSNDKERKDI